MENNKLRTGRVFAIILHHHGAGKMMTSVFIFIANPISWMGGSIVGRTTGSSVAAGHYMKELQPVVISVFGQFDKVCNRIGCFVLKQLDDHITISRL